ncbi:MAG: S-layer homology domain-containing protein [Leptolyngbyaceae cyanobacterium SL_1_1]|nr:S-layer homology domain-containing protein [Leptolyngbyaceae cyanobacterium SL_1_1]
MGRRSQRQWAWLLTFVFAFMLALGMAQRLPVAAQQSPGNPAIPQIILPVDTGNHWAYQCIQALAQSGGLRADQFPAGRFRPDEGVTWRALISWLTAAPVPTPPPKPPTMP